MRSCLELAKREGEGFEAAWRATLDFIATRPVESAAADRARAHAVRALADVSDHWRAAYLGVPDPEPPKPKPLPTVPLNLGEMRRLFRQAKPKRCVHCRAWFTPSWNHSLSCSEECARERRRAVQRAWYRRRRKARQVPVPG